VHVPDAPSPLATATALATTDAARHSAASALVALNAAVAATTPPPVREFIEDLAGMLPLRLTVHQRETLEASLVRAVAALIPLAATD
jgi:hypothetical protein